MHALDELNSKLNMLLKKHAAVESENKRLKEAIAKQVKKEEQLNNQILLLQQGVAGANIAKAVVTSEDKENMRQQLDSLISEIDGILNTLND
ncbi:MAG: hypothetical protein K9G49_15260 [Taibaiella sp.]|nr:hypothetical protein [Taibaiella sp.]